MKVTTIYVEAKRSHKYQTYTVGMTAEVNEGEEITAIPILQNRCRAATQAEIDLDAGDIGQLPDDTPIAEESVVPAPTADQPAPAKPRTPNPDQLGALWKKEGKINGRVGDADIGYTEEEFYKKFQEVTSKNGKQMYEGMIGERSVRILPNAYKNAPNQPDFVIFKGR